MKVGEGLFEAGKDLLSTASAFKTVIGNPFSKCARTELAKALYKDWQDAKKRLPESWVNNIEGSAKWVADELRSDVNYARGFLEDASYRAANAAYRGLQHTRNAAIAGGRVMKKGATKALEAGEAMGEEIVKDGKAVVGGVKKGAQQAGKAVVNTAVATEK